MSAGIRIAGFAALLAAIFGAASVTGAAIAPDVSEGGHETSEGSESETSEDIEASSDEPAAPGLAVSEGGYTLIPQTTRIDRRFAPFRFRIGTQSGATLQRFDVEHERRMHLIVVRRDFEGFQHLHPRQLDDGGWKVDLALSQGGVYRAFADFATEGESVTLATDLFVPGRFEPSRLPPPTRDADAGDGYNVALDAAEARAGAAAVRFVVSRRGRKLSSVEPYLGADGHLVALREHDQAFLHTHPEGEAGGPGPITYAVEYPSAGRYRLFLQFKHRGEVRTAAFTQVVRADPDEDADTAGEESEHGGH